MAMPWDGVHTLRDTCGQLFGAEQSVAVEAIYCCCNHPRTRLGNRACVQRGVVSCITCAIAPLQQCSNNARSLRGVGSQGPYGVWQLILDHPCHHQRQNHCAAQAFQSHKVFFSLRENPFEHSTPMKGYRVGRADVIPAPVQDPGRGPGSRRGEGGVPSVCSLSRGVYSRHGQGPAC